MSIQPNRYGPFCPVGEITGAAAGTSQALSVNFTPAYAADPNLPVTVAAPVQYAIAFEDVIVNSPPNNSGGIYITNLNGSKDSPDTILLYIPKGSGPVSIKKFLGGSRFNPNSMAVDFDQNGDKAWIVGVVGS